MDRITQSVAKRVVLKAFLSSDHISPATGKTIAVVISKNGAAFGNPNAGATNATEIGNGWYYVDLDTTDTGTLGPLVVRGTEGTIDPTEIAFSVEQSIQAEANAALVANHLDHLLAATYDPSSKPGASDALLNELIENDGGVARFTANALEQAPAGGGGGDATEAKQDIIIGLIGTPAADLAADIAAVHAKTTNLPSDPADASVVAGLIAGVDGKVDTVDLVVDAIKAKTDQLTFTGSNKVHADLKAANGTAIAGDGAGTPWGPA